MNRVKADGEAFYHVVSRIANKAFLIRDAARKRRLLDMLRRAASGTERSKVCSVRTRSIYSSAAESAAARWPRLPKPASR